jgi:hypothetical protein
MAKNRAVNHMLSKCKQPGCYNDAVVHGGFCVTHAKRMWPKLEYTQGRNRPRSNKPHLGCEIECVGATPEIEKAMRSCGRSPCHDGSLHGGIGCEFKFCSYAPWCITYVTQFAEMLANVGAAVNGTCGMHVHLDARGMSDARKTEFIRWLKEWQDWWFSLVPRKRRNGEYVQKIGSEHTFREHKTWAHITGYPTIEIRLHPGTINVHKLRAWLTVCWNLMTLLRGNDPLPKPKWAGASTAKPLKWADGEETVVEDVTDEFLSKVLQPESIEYLRARQSAGGKLTVRSATSRGPLVESEGGDSDV